MKTRTLCKYEDGVGRPRRRGMTGEPRLFHSLSTSPPACQVGDSWLAGLWLYSTTAPPRASTTPEAAAMSSK